MGESILFTIIMWFCGAIFIGIGIYSFKKKSPIHFAGKHRCYFNIFIRGIYMEKSFNCLRCNEEMKYLKEYRFDSQDNNRGIFAAIFDIEEHLSFHVYVCPKCRHTEFFFTGASKGFDSWVDV